MFTVTLCITYSMLDVSKQKTRCVMLRFYKVTKGRPYTEIMQRVYCLHCVPTGPFFWNTQQWNPHEGTFQPHVTDLFSFFLSSYHRACGVRGNITAVFPVVLSVRPAILRPVFASLTRNNTLLWTLTYTCILLLSLSKPFMLFITSCLLTRMKQFSERLSGVKLEKQNWVNKKKSRFCGFLCTDRLFCPGPFEFNIVQGECHCFVIPAMITLSPLLHRVWMRDILVWCVLCKGIYLFLCVLEYLCIKCIRVL